MRVKEERRCERERICYDCTTLPKLKTVVVDYWRRRLEEGENICELAALSIRSGRERLLLDTHSPTDELIVSNGVAGYVIFILSVGSLLL